MRSTFAARVQPHIDAETEAETCACGQGLDLYGRDLAAHDHCPRCGRTLK